MKIIFMGTGYFALPTLQKLIANQNFDIVGIYTKEPKITSKRNYPPPIFQEAKNFNLPIFTPKSLKSSEEWQRFKSLGSDIAVVVSYGLLLPKEILLGTKFGCVNLHPSLLPKWRGAAPIERMIENGDQETGISFILMNEGLDSGDVIFQNKFTVGDCSAIDLIKKTSQDGANIICQILPQFLENKIKRNSQDDNQATYAKKILKSELEINWHEEADNIIRKIKAFDAKGGCYFIHNGKRIKIFTAKLIENNDNLEAGKIIDKNFTIKCQKDAIRPIFLQQEGKKKMVLKEFLQGLSILSGS
jgi:methionyl-tRNA formyltransferase